MRRAWLVGLVSCAAAAALSAQGSDIDRLRARLDAVAGDALRGRALGSAEHQRVLRVLSDAARAIGLREVASPPLPVVELSIGASTAMGSLNRPQRAGLDIVPMYPDAWGYPAKRELTLNAVDIIRVGRVGPATRAWTAYNNQVVLVEPPLRPNGTVDYDVERFLEEMRGLRSAAAIGIIVLDVVPLSWLQRQTARRFALPGPSKLEGWPPIFLVTAQNAEATVPDQKGRERLKLVIDERRVTPAPRNVVFELQGSDPALRREYVVLSAPSDYRGVRAASIDEDSIYNGADDGGSGAVALLGVAERLLRDGVRPKRSILFVWHAGTEHGLLGSEWFVRTPPVRLGRIAAVINVERLGRGGDTLFAVGSPQTPASLRAQLNQYAGTKSTVLDWSWDVPTDPLRRGERSDHRPYAEAKIPAVTINSGVHEDWRTVHDKVDRVSLERLTARIDWLAGALRVIGDREEHE